MLRDRQTFGVAIQAADRLGQHLELLVRTKSLKVLVVDADLVEDVQVLGRPLAGFVDDAGLGPQRGLEGLQRTAVLLQHELHFGERLGVLADGEAHLLQAVGVVDQALGEANRLVRADGDGHRADGAHDLASRYAGAVQSGAGAVGFLGDLVEVLFA